MPIKATIDNDDVLIISGNEYIRIEKSKKPNFKGLWKQNLQDDVQERDYCSYLFLDLNIDIDENNDFIIKGGYIANNNFNIDENIVFNYNSINSFRSYCHWKHYTKRFCRGLPGKQISGIYYREGCSFCISPLCTHDESV